MIRTVPVHFIWGLHTQMSIRMSDAHLLAIGSIVPSESFSPREPFSFRQFDKLLHTRGDCLRQTTLVFLGQQQLFLRRVGDEPTLHQHRRHIQLQDEVIPSHGCPLFLGLQLVDHRLLHAPSQQPSTSALESILPARPPTPTSSNPESAGPPVT